MSVSRRIGYGAAVAAAAATLALGGCGDLSGPANPPDQQQRVQLPSGDTPSPLPTHEPTTGHCCYNGG